ncbi:hypothetical protein H4R18_005186 [Coemansia javaensis]|uniref:Uncharacterized protein n=1 Tax=Coemansia javaensis TaxID=2761396 RepID=A0A9W8LF78_9FUNG|nr:hypothetical protein H4R18_005186 [Coemansia javaensis]
MPRKVTVTINNLTTNKIVLKDIPDTTGYEEFFLMVEAQHRGSDPKKYRIGTRMMGEFRPGMELRDFGAQQTIYLEKLG